VDSEWRSAALAIRRSNRASSSQLISGRFGCLQRKHWCRTWAKWLGGNYRIDFAAAKTCGSPHVERKLPQYRRRQAGATRNGQARGDRKAGQLVLEGS